MLQSPIDITIIEKINQGILKALKLRNESSIVSMFLDMGLEIFGADYGFCYIADKSDNLTLLSKTSATPYQPKPPRPNGTLTRVVNQGVPELFSSVNKDDTIRADAKENMASCIVIPVSSDEDRFGVIVLAFHKKQTFYSHQNITAALYGNACATALTIFKLNNRLFQYKNILDKTGVMTFFVDEVSLKILYANQEASKFYSTNARELTRYKIFELNNSTETVYRQRIAEAAKEESQSTVYEVTVKDPTGKRVPIESYLQRMQAKDGATKILIMMRDISERKGIEKKLAIAASYDELTQLPNRRSFQHKLSELLTPTKATPAKEFSLLFFDLDRFKFINDILGHTAGDDLLKLVAKRLRTLVKRSDLLARLGGDEFVLLLNGVGTPDRLQEIASRILLAFRKPFVINKQNIYMNTSIGSSTFPDDGQDAQSLIRKADIALYTAKDEGRGRYKAYQNTYSKSTNELTIEKDLIDAIAYDQFELYYQPQIDAKSKKIVGVEALIRWNHPALGLLNPNQFIPIAEETGAITDLSKWIITRTIIDIKSLRKVNPQLTVSINLSIRDLIQPEITAFLIKTLQEHKIKKGVVRVEITETQVMRRPDLMVKILAKLQKHGISTYIDDFGIGYTSIKYLKDLPVQGVKIDKSFISGINSSNRDQVILKSIISLCHQLKLTAIAEGVETKQQLTFLTRHKCDLIQGYYICTPLSLPELLEWLKQKT